MRGVSSALADRDGVMAAVIQNHPKLNKIHVAESYAQLRLQPDFTFRIIIESMDRQLLEDTNAASG